MASRRRLRSTSLALTCAAVVAIAVPASGQPPAPDDLGSARDQLAGARRELVDIEAQVRRVNDEVAAADTRLRTATTELAQVRGQLADAEQALAAALTTERARAAELADADAELTGLLDDWEGYRDRLEQRAVEVYKQGTVLPHDLLVRGVAGATDLHELTVNLEFIGRLARQDKDLADRTAAITRDTADVRAAVGAARTRAVDAARAAAEERRRVEALVQRAERLVAQVGEERERRAAALASLEADAAARAVLVRQLEEHVAALERSARSVLVPVADLDEFGPPPAWAGRLPAAGRPYAAAIEATAARHGLDGRLLAALVWTESAFRPDAVSHAGAIGLAQLMPGTARGLGVDPRDPLQNLDGGARYVRSQLARFGRVDLALAAYNAGPGRVQAAGGVPNIVETQLYVVRVLDRYRALGG